MAGRPSEEILEGFIQDSHALTTEELCGKYHRAKSTISEWRQYARAKGHDVGLGPSPTTVYQEDVEFDLPFEEDALEGIQDALTAMGKATRLTSRRKEAHATFRFEAMPVMVVFWGDWHIGGEGDLELFLGDLEILTSTPGVKVVGMGDYKHNVSRAPFVLDIVDLIRPGWQDALIVRRYMPMLTGHVLGLLMGNHDFWDHRHDVPFIEEACRACQAKYLWHQCKLEFIFPSAVYEGIVRHKPRRESSLNTTNAQRALYENQGNPDFIAVAHRHYADLHQKRRTDGGQTIWLRSGTYSPSDEYTQRVIGHEGDTIFPGIIFLPDRALMLPYWDFKQGLPRLSLLRSLYEQGFDIDYELEHLKGLL